MALSGSSSLNKHGWARSAPWMSPSGLWWRLKAFKLGVRGRSDINPLICNTSVYFSSPSNDCAKDLGEILFHGIWSVVGFWSWCGPMSSCKLIASILLTDEVHFLQWTTVVPKAQTIGEIFCNRWFTDISLWTTLGIERQNWVHLILFTWVLHFRPDLYYTCKYIFIYF